MKLRRLAVARMRQEDWAAWCALDAQFQPDFEHYRKRMDATVKRLKAAGINVVEVTLTPGEFLAWSKATGAGVDTHARAHYAVVKAMQMDAN